MAVREADNLVNTATLVQAASRTGDPVLKQPTCNWKAEDKCQEQQNFKIEYVMLLAFKDDNTTDSL